MKEHQQYFLYTLLIIVIISGGAAYYETTTLNRIRSEYTTQIATLNDELASTTQRLESLIEEQGSQIHTRISDVETTQEQQFKTIGKELSRVEEESTQKVGELEKTLLNIDVETKGFTTVVEQVKDSIVSLRTDTGYGSGVVVGVNGYVLTNYHVIDGIKALSIGFASGKKYPGRIAGYDTKADLALIKIGSDDRFKALSFAKSKDLSVGQKVIAMGSPAGLDFTVTEGIISSLDRQNSAGFDMIQTSVPINPGSSGGPLIDGRGLIAGINTYKVSGAEALGFALNPDDAHTFTSLTINKDEALIEAAQEN